MNAYADFVTTAAALVAANDRARQRAELRVAGDFERWDDEFWSGYLAGPSERIAS